MCLGPVEYRHLALGVRIRSAVEKNTDTSRLVSVFLLVSVFFRSINTDT